MSNSTNQPGSDQNNQTSKQPDSDKGNQPQKQQQGNQDQQNAGVKPKQDNNAKEHQQAPNSK